MNQKILTITVPSYNVEKYLNDTLESFVNSEVMDGIGTPGISRRMMEVISR